jgi:T5SS/PEP-CTERM-associated repeat protein
MLASLVAIAGGVCPAGSAIAAQRVWNAPGGGALGQPSNWLGGVVPGLGDEGLFNLGAAYNATLAAALTTDRFSVGGDEFTINLGTNTLALQRAIGLTDPSLAVGLQSGVEGAITFVNGDVFSIYTSLGLAPGSLGSATVSGATSWTNNQTMVVGDAGVGSLSVLNGAELLTGPSRIGLASTGDGAALVSGSGATWTNGFSMRVGLDGVGQVTVNGGGFAEASAVELGYNSAGDGDAVVTGADSVLRAAGAMTIGRSGAGTLLVSGEGEARAGSASVGMNGGSVGGATVRDANSKWTVTNALDVGQNGSGMLTIEQNGLVTASSANVSGGAGSGSVTLTSGGTLDVQFQMGVGLGSGGLGTVSLDGGTLEATTLTIGPSGQLNGRGTVVANLINAGLIRVGAPQGLLGVQGSFDQSTGLGGTVLVELAPTAEVMVINGSATLGGRLTVALAPGFTPSPGQEFTVFSATSRMGEFDTVQLPASSGGLTYTLEYRAGNAVVVVGGGLPEDLNGDGSVDGADLGLLLGAWGPGAGPADLNGDSIVNGADLGLLLAAWTV